MSDRTNRHRLPYILPSQAQKHVTHNEALRAIDSLLQAAVIDVRDTPPAAPQEGDCHIAGAAPTGAWAGRAGEICAFVDSAWMFFPAAEGHLVWEAANAVLLVRRSGNWQPVVSPSMWNPTARVGVNAAADDTNRLSVAAAATLFSHAGNDHRVKINKATGADTAAVLFQNGFSGRAEIGLTGDENLRVKVSADGAVWREAMVVDRSTGAATFPNTVMGGAPGGIAGQVQVNDSGQFGGSDLNWSGASKRLGLNVSTPAHSLQVEKTQADRLSASFAMTGWGRSGSAPGDAHGVGLYLTLNQAGNRQFALLDTSNGTGVRFLNNTIDAVTNFGGARADIQVGTDSNGAHVAAPVANTQFSVSNHNGAASKVVTEIAGHLNQSGDLLRVSTYHFGSSGNALRVRADRSAAFGGPAQLASYTVATLPSAANVGSMIHVSDEAGGAVPAFSDGVNWRRVTDRAVVS